MVIFKILGENFKLTSQEYLNTQSVSFTVIVHRRHNGLICLQSHDFDDNNI